MNTQLFKVVTTGIGPDAIRTALNETPHDSHFGEVYRHRSMSRFRVSEDASVEQLPAMPLYQSNDINPLEGYGGIYRDYAELPESLVAAPAFKQLVDVWLRTLPEGCETFSVHHIRTKAPGSPVPEGRHRDGYEFVGLCILQRDGVDPKSGLTQFWNRESDELIFEGVLGEGDFAIFDDRDHLHYTSEVTAEQKNGAGAGEATAVRDVLIFTVPDHGLISPEYEVS